MEKKTTLHQKTQKTRSDTAVQGTNDNSIVSKMSAVQQGYIKDEFLKYVVRKPCRRAPLINRGYYVRAKAMDHVFTSFLKQYADINQVVNLGAGFDMTYFRLFNQGLLQHTHYFEVDFPEVVNRKCNSIQFQPELVSLLADMKINPSPNIALSSSKYSLLGIDLTDLVLLNTTLTAAGFRHCVPTLFVSEVVLCYMSSHSSSKLIEWAAAIVKHGIFLTYEQVYPDDAFGRIMMKHFESLGSRLKTIKEYPTLHDQVYRYQKKGWAYVKALDANYFFHHYLSKAERSRVYNLEPFDEFEEWQLKCTHYMILTAFSGSCVQFAEYLWPKISFNKTNKIDTGSEPGNEADWFQVGVLVATDCSRSVSCCGSRTGQGICCSLPSDVYAWDFITSDDGVFNSCNKRFGHTANKISVLMESSLHRQSDLNTDENSINLSQTAQCMSSECSPNSSETELTHSSSSSSNQKDNTDQMLIVYVGGFGVSNNRHARLSTLDVLSFTMGKRAGLELSGDAHHFDRIYHSSTNISESKLIIFGGRFSPTRPCDTGSVYVLTFAGKKQGRDNTILCRSEVIHTTGILPCPRWRHSSTSIIWQGSQYILVYGGKTESDTLNDIHLLSTETWTWSKVEPSGQMPQNRHSHTADVWGDSLLITGGLSDDEVAMDTIYKLSFPTSSESFWKWTKLTLTGSIRPRYSHTSAVFRDHLYVIGGISTYYPPPGISVINLLTLSVQEFMQPNMDSGPIMMLHNHASVLAQHEQSADIYVLGGGGNCFSFGTHLNENPALFIVKTLKDR